MFYDESENIYDDLFFLKQRLMSVSRSNSANDIMPSKEISYFSKFLKSESEKMGFKPPELIKYCKTSGEIFKFLQQFGGYADRDSYISQVFNPIIDLYDGYDYYRDERSNVNLKEEMLSNNGSYAIVYKFKDKITDRYLAYKVLRKNLTDKETKRFYYEYSVMSELNSNNIVKVYRQTEDGYIMELCDCTLDEYIKKKNSELTTIDRRRLLTQLFRVIDYIHKKGFFHRDLSYRNILVIEYDDYPTIKIADFGLVKTSESSLTSLNTEIKGSLADPWLNLHGFKNYGVLNEIYSLGFIVNKIITGKDTIRLNEIDNVDYKNFIEKCINSDLNERFDTIVNMARECFNKFDTFFV